MVSPSDSELSPAKFGTFGGVFTPCTLTILGVIMFLRFGLVVGTSGLWATIAIVLCAKSITLLTTFSLSAIATNTRVKGGGAYYLISRSLGVEFGGAIGLVFFLAQAISVSLYVIGFAEAVQVSFPNSNIVVTSTITNTIVFLCVFIGAGWTIKLQYGILAVLAASLVSFYTGAAGKFQVENLQASIAIPITGETFFAMFALFFPAVTGIMAGANMSGDLRDPARSIPTGTLWAILVTAVIYVTQAFAMAGAADANALCDTDSMVMANISAVPILITAGVFAATLSSALGSMMGAPRILQAFSRDNVFPWLHPFAAGSKKTGEPRRAIVLTFMIAQICILLADLNTIAPLITMFFMITYGLLNFATFCEAVTGNPSYRPRFRYTHWSISLLGMLGCLAVMFLMDWKWASVSILTIGGLHWLIGRNEIEARWGDLNSGLLFERTRKNLLKLEGQLYHPKNWRPIILAMTGATKDRQHLAVNAHWFTSGHGILTLGHVLQGEFGENMERRASVERIFRDFIRHQELEAFTGVVVSPTVAQGIASLIQCEGLGALRPNTIMFGWPKIPERAAQYGTLLRTVAQFQRSIIAVRFVGDLEDPWQAPPGTIDVWWRGRKNGELMLLLAHLLTRNGPWRTRPIRLLRTVENPAGQNEVLDHLKGLIDHSRIQATPMVIVSDDPRAAIRATSRHAAMTLLGFEPPEEGDEIVFFERMEDFAGEIPRVVLVSSVGGMSLES